MDGKNTLEPVATKSAGEGTWFDPGELDALGTWFEKKAASDDADAAGFKKTMDSYRASDALIDMSGKRWLVRMLTGGGY